MIIYENEIERRNVPGDAPTITPRGDKLPTIIGYAAVFNVPSAELVVNGRRFREVVKPGAFADSLRTGVDVLARFEHTEIIGRTGNGTLRLSEDQRGLRYEIDPPDTQLGRDLVKMIRRKDVVHSSFAFRVNPGGETWRRENGGEVRELRSVRLVDVSPVSAASYPTTSVSLRAAWRGALDWMAAKLRLASADDVCRPASSTLRGMARRLREAKV